MSKRASARIFEWKCDEIIGLPIQWLHHVPSMTSNACVVEEFASEGATAVVATAAASKDRSTMFLQLGNSDLHCGLVSEHVMTLAASNPLALCMNLMGESEVVSLAHLRRWILVARDRMTLATTRTAHLLARLHLFGSLVANVALSMTGKSCTSTSHCMAARTIGPLLTALISRMSLMRKLDSERLALGKVDDRRLDRRYALVTIGADRKLSRGECFDVTRNASAVAGHNGHDRVGFPHVTLIAFHLIVCRVIEFLSSQIGRGRLNCRCKIRKGTGCLALPREGRRYTKNQCCEANKNKTLFYDTNN